MFAFFGFGEHGWVCLKKGKFFLDEGVKKKNRRLNERGKSASLPLSLTLLGSKLFVDNKR